MVLCTVAIGQLRPWRGKGNERKEKVSEALERRWGVFGGVSTAIAIDSGVSCAGGVDELWGAGEDYGGGVMNSMSIINQN